MDPTRSWRRWLLVVCALALLARWGSASRDDSRLGSCLAKCERTGCAASSCLPSCHRVNSSVEQYSVTETLPPYQRWKEWICSTECRYHCTLSKETEDAGVEQAAIGYRANWCLARVMANDKSSNDLYLHLAKSAITPGIHLGLINEPASVAFAALNLLGNLIGLLTFLKLVHYSLPSRPISRGPYYPFAGLWTIYGVLATMYWSAQCIFHARSMTFDKHIDSTFEVVLAAYTLVLAIVRVGDIRREQGRVVVISPAVAFLGPHLFYINLCNFNYGESQQSFFLLALFCILTMSRWSCLILPFECLIRLNIQVCLALGTLQYLLWITWAAVTKHPARYQLWLLASVVALASFLRLYDFSYLWGVLDADALWIALTIPSSFMWWSFAQTDATYQTKLILKKRDAQGIHNVEPKKML